MWPWLSYVCHICSAAVRRACVRVCESEICGCCHARPGRASQRKVVSLEYMRPCKAMSLKSVRPAAAGAFFAPLRNLLGYNLV